MYLLPLCQQEELAGVDSEVCEVRRRMGEEERELEDLLRQQQALEDKCERVRKLCI